MSLLAPAFLWSLLALLPLAAVYFLKVRPRKRETTAYFLWEKIFSEKKASSLFQRLRDVLSLIILAIAFAAIALALSRPKLSDDERRDLLLLIDRSASMSAEAAGSSRLDEARDAAREIVLALDGNQRAAIATVTDEIRYESHFSRSLRGLLDSLDRIEPSDTPLSVDAVDRLVGNLGDRAEDFRVILLTDGNFTGDVSGESVEVLKIGESTGNIGFVAADLQRLPGGRLGFYFRLASSYEEPIEADLLLKHLDDAGSERIAKVIPTTIAPGENEPEIFELEEAEAGRWIAEIELEDPLAKDDVVYLTLPEQEPIRVAVTTENRYFFETSILAFQQSGGMTLVGESEAPDLVVEQRVASGAADLAIVFTPDGESPWWGEVGPPVEAVAPRVRVEDHPALRHVDLESVAFIGARQIAVPESALILVESETAVPLVWVAEAEGKRALVVNLDPIQADFYFSTWFPALIYGTATHLAGREVEVAPVVRVGERIAVPGFREGETTEIRVPEVENGHPFAEKTYGPVEKLGFYELENSSGAWSIGASLMSAGESLLRGDIEDTTEALSRGRAPSYWLLALAILLLVSESILYQRRKVG